MAYTLDSEVNNRDGCPPLWALAGSEALWNHPSWGMGIGILFVIGRVQDRCTTFDLRCRMHAADDDPVLAYIEFVGPVLDMGALVQVVLPIVEPVDDADAANEGLYAQTLPKSVTGPAVKEEGRRCCR